MNKKEFIEVIKQELNCDEEKGLKICNILEDHFLIGKNNKEKIIVDLMEQLHIEREEAGNIYEVTSKTIAKEIKNKLFHPFGNGK